ncbi:SusC/RagA family TonB-linked outer membrane protein [Flagellimonas olearia]|uniref:SusC/RagA family TonB-linked outer membrane protein n=1 Tax=Flagellimonas olearia TaxID=552546 RepID=A0A6I1E324_9FLAO|nr:SusC/RagA family TonB-linked outer membrane protein [Allomuricauda olearia]KAB7530255.1 SusC/RagA family TonB-linked outer membrane protein [Allomuricauda olearia]
MKLSVFFLIVSFFSAEASTYSQKAMVTLDMENVEMGTVLENIEAQTKFKFFFDSNKINVRQKVSISADNTVITDVLDNLFKGTQIFYIFRKEQIVLNIRTLKSHASDQKENISKSISPAQMQVSGTIKDSNGTPIPGVSVVEKNTSNGTAADFDGNYALTLQGDNAVLVFSSIGFAPQEIPVGQSTRIDVVLREDAESLDEVVVTALGMSREKAALPYSVSEVKGDKLTQAREINLGTALSGRVAGVNVTSTANGPNGSSRVIIRGNGSLSGENQPLYVVNGVPMNNTNQGNPGTYGGVDGGDGLVSINPDDIESISVLKGGTAAALYGSRAANGVILITTKSGSAQQGLGVEVNSTFTMETPLSFPDWQYQYGSGSQGQKPSSLSEAVAYGRTSWGAPLDGSPVIQPDGNEHPYSAQKDNIRNFYDNGTTFSNTVAINAGNEDAQMRFSVSNMDNKGIVPNASMNRKTFNLSGNANLGKRIEFEGRAQYSIEQNKNRTYVADFTKNPNASVGLVATNIDVRTLAPGYDERGYEKEWNDYVFVVNPYFASEKVKNQDERRRFIGSFVTKLNITDYLYARTRIGIDYFNIEANDITPTGILYSPRGSMSEREVKTYETNIEALLGFNKRFGNISVNAIAGGNKMYTQNKQVEFSSGLFNVPFTYFITNGSSPTFEKGFREMAINSLFGSVDIGYNDYLYLTFTGRNDWFSTLSPESNNLFYPSVGASFEFSDAWASKPEWLSYGKIRSSWAQVGGGAPDPYGLNLAYVAQTASHLGQQLMNVSSNNIPNTLKPYTSTTAEVGLDLRFFQSRLGVDLTLYNRTTTDDIVNASVPFSSGYRSVSLNVGKISNKGVELLVTGTPIDRSKDFGWEVSYNLAYNKNTVERIADGLTSLHLPGATARTQNGFIYHYEGMPFGMVAGYKRQTNDNGDIVYNQANGLPLQGDFVALGRGVPPLTMGLTNNFTYKNFSMGVLLDGKFGSKLYTSTNAYGTYYGLHKNTVANGVRENGVQVSGVDTNGNPYSATIDAQTYFQNTAFSITDDFVSDAGFIKLRQLTFGYTFPHSILTETPFEHVSVSFVARNLMLLYSQVDNVDPESNYSNSNAQGLENFGVPPTRSFGLNLMARF